MESIRIIANACYLPEMRVDNKILAERLGVTEEYIWKRTGIKSRGVAGEETLEEMAIEAARRVVKKANWDKDKIGMIIVATTSTKCLMPGVSFGVQRALEISDCNCMDILAGCAGYVSALEIARNAIAVGKVESVLVIGAEKLTNYMEEKDLGTAIILSDGAGATLVSRAEKKKVKQFESYIQADGLQGDILTCYTDGSIEMNGKKVYRYAVTQTVQNIKALLEKTHTKIEEIAYIIPHQSNQKIMEAIAQRLGIGKEKMVMHIENVGNTFCASIPIVLTELEEKNLLCEGQKVILLGYGGGVNTASILLEI